MDYTVVEFEYVNHRGEQACRRVRPIRLYFGCTAFHPEAQWMLECWDVDRGETRDFAVGNILGGWKRSAADTRQAQVSERA